MQDMGEGRSIFLSSKSILRGFFMLPLALARYRDHTIISSHGYLNAVLGALRRIGYLRGRLIARESTSIFLRYKGLHKNIYSLLYRAGYPALDTIITQSELMSQQLRAQAPYLNPQRIRVVDNPLDFALARQMGESEQPPEQGGYICAAGRLIAIKGFDVLICAFAQISSSYPELKLVILGEGEQRGYLSELIERLSLTHRVILAGYKANPFSYFRRAKLCVVSSALEGFPNVLLQMMAVNSCIVSTLCAGGIADIPGIIKVQPSSKFAMETALRSALDQGEINRGEIDEYLLRRSPKGFLQKVMQSR